jgi:hypothetical protein
LELCRNQHRVISLTYACRQRRRRRLACSTRVRPLHKVFNSGASYRTSPLLLSTMPPLKARYHPYLFVFITLCAIAELGLTSYLINLGNQIGFAEASYHSLLVEAKLSPCPQLIPIPKFDFISLQFGQSHRLPDNPDRVSFTSSRSGLLSLGLLTRFGL